MLTDTHSELFTKTTVTDGQEAVTVTETVSETVSEGKVSMFGSIQATLSSGVRSTFASVGEYVVYGAVYAVTAGVIAVGGTSEERAAVWSEWTSSADPEAPHEEQVWLIPRWATLEPKSGGYDAVVNIQACCIDFLLLHSASRTQRALVGIARRFADLPSDVVVDQSNVDRVLEKAGHPEGHSERLERAHLLLDTRLAPFWAGELPGRTIRFKIHLVQTHRASYLRSGEITTMPAVGPELWETEPVAVGEYVTNGNGLVATELHIPWKDIEAKAPTAVVDALKQRHSVGVVIHAKMLDSEALTRVVVLPLRASNGVRLISDMDDTVKRSEILGGAKMVFRNVFCRPSEDLAVRGMAELFADLADEGAKGLHFVSNSPYELLPSISEFLAVNKFPPSSLSLKEYNGRGLFALFSGAGERKRPGLEEVFNAFPQSTFLLFGDSGEQDLEIYTLLARERPHQVSGIFIRDVTTVSRHRWRSSGVKVDRVFIMPGGYPGEFNAPLPEELGPTESPESISGTSSPLETAQSPEEERQTVADLQALTIEEENLWQMANKWEERLQRVREALPKSVPLAIFKEPEEVRDLAERLVRGETLPADCDLYGDGKSGAAVRAAASDAHASPEGKTVKQAAGEAQECV